MMDQRNTESRGNLSGEKLTKNRPPEAPMNDIEMVGPHKPMGCMLLVDATELYHSHPDTLLRTIHAKGLNAIISEPNKSSAASLLIVWDDAGLQQVLNKNKAILQANHWPTDQEHFVYMTSTVRVPVKTKLYDVIADAYGDYRNPNRLVLGHPSMPR